MQRRPYGKTGIELSVIGLGGFTLSGLPQEEASRLVDKVFDRGVNYFDVAPSYGNAEELLGPALKGKRQDVFLACKTLKRSAREAEQEFVSSLKRLRTDEFDLYQLHSVNKMEDLEALTAPKGALDFLIRARDKGMCRFIGFSSHSEEMALRLLDAFPFDSVLFPINWVSMLNTGYGKALLEKAAAMGATRLAIKAIAMTAWGPGEERTYPNCWYHPVEDPDLAKTVLRFTLSQDVTAAIPPADRRFYDLALEVGDDFEPVSEDEVERLRGVAAGIAPLFGAGASS